MAEKRLYGRVIQKHDTEANWLKAVNFVPLNGEIIVYMPDENYEYHRLKVGDGVTNVNDQPFVHEQPDWSEGDENSAAFVKNRTHWTYSGEIELFYDEEPADIGYDATTMKANKMYSSETYHAFEDGKTYWVKYGNETVAECIAANGMILFTMQDSAGISMSVQISSLDDTSQYWLNITMPDENAPMLNETLGLYTEGEVVQPLEEKYVPAITDEEIDAICGAVIYAASEVEL